MNIYLLAGLYILSLIADILIIKRHWFNRYSPELQTGLLFLILFLPSILMSIKISNDYFINIPLYLKVLLSVIVIIVFNSTVYMIIKKIFG